jgi:hypothetical protein
VLALAMLWTAVANSAVAQGTNLTSVQVHPHGFVVQRPSAATASPRNGLTLEVDSRWVNNYGYRPIRVRVSSLKPVTRDHVVTIRFHIAAWDWRSGVIDVEQDIELLTGQTEATAVVTCPQFQTGHRYWWDVWVDGKKDDSLSVDANTAWQLTAASSNAQGDVPLKFLLVGRPQFSPTLIPNTDMFEALAMPIDLLPTRWLDFTTVDVLAISPRDLEWLHTKQPETLKAIRRWIRAGGQAWISPVGRQWKSVPRVEELLGIKLGESAEAAAAPVDRGWQPIKLSSGAQAADESTFIYLPTGRTRAVRDPLMIARLENDPDWEVVQKNLTPSADDANKLKLPADSGQWYVQRPLGLGHVRVFREAWDPIGFGISLQMLRGLSIFDPAQTSPLTTPLTAAMETTRTWESRHGLTPDTANSDFADWLVPGVGRAPVNEFRVLITLFVLVIGPLNYWLLQRTHRLHLLVLTVPLTAAVLTIGLFVYALASDGISTKVRVRSFTSLDQRTGEAACWARLSYYAALAPGRGLTLPDDTAIYPITPGWNEASNNASFGGTRQIEWTGGRQRLTEGWLRSRTPTQYLTIRARKSPAKLLLEPTAERIATTNELGTDIRYVAVADDDGSVFVGEAIENGATAELHPADREQVLRRLQRFLRENRPSAPAELTGESTFIATQQRRQQRRFLRNQYGLSYGLERLGGNLQSSLIDGLVGTDELPALNLAPRTYVAITETGPEVTVGVANAREEASFHVLVAHW